jgi:pimeloyl-ACP methyl ester carboxylesterase
VDEAQRKLTMRRTHKLTATVLTIAALGLAGGAAEAQPTTTLGHSIHGSGPENVIILHDWLGSSATWDPVLPYLDTDRFTFVLADVRGYGASIDMTGAYSTDEITADVFALADGLGFDTFHLIGHSMTAMAGFNAISHSDGERIESYIAVAPTPPGGFPADQDTRDFFAAIPHNPDMTQSAFHGLTGSRYEATRWAQIKTDHNLATSSEAAMHGYGEMIYEDLSAQLAAAPPQMPVLVIAGTHDLPAMQPEALAESAADLVPNATVVAIDGSGHYPMDETPPRLAQLIQEHLLAHADQHD